MNIFQSLLLGLVQGVTEFLPVSSSGHLVVLQSLFGFSEASLLFDILLHTATLGAVFVFFRKEAVKVFRSALTPAAWRNTPEGRMFFFIILGTAVTGVIGILGKEYAEGAFHSVRITGCMFLVTAALLYAASRGKKIEQDILTLHPGTALMIGCIQGIAILPGISRSGATISLALLLGWKREQAFSFSFLLLIPAVVGALCLESIDLMRAGNSLSIPFSWLAGILSAFVVGIASLHLLKKIIQINKLSYFSCYCFLLGVIVLGISFISG